MLNKCLLGFPTSLIFQKMNPLKQFWILQKFDEPRGYEVVKEVGRLWGKHYQPGSALHFSSFSVEFCLIEKGKRLNMCFLGEWLRLYNTKLLYCSLEGKITFLYTQTLKEVGFNLIKIMYNEPQVFSVPVISLSLMGVWKADEFLTHILRTNRRRNVKIYPLVQLFVEYLKCICWR